jgi:hypothetical protein
MHKIQNIKSYLLWELMKSDISGYSIKYSFLRKKQETVDIKNKEGEWIDIFFLNNISSFLLNTGWASPFVSVTRGIRQ